MSAFVTQNKPNAKNQKWRISSSEIGVDVEGQFTVDQIQINTVGGVYAEISTVNQSHPITQWIRGQQETITLTSELWANDSKDDIVSKFTNLLRLTRRDDKLCRAPICSFSFGQALSIQCFLEHVSNIGYGPLRPDGTPQRIHFTLTVRNYVPSVVNPTDPSKPESQSRIRQSKTGDTYESIAADEYGDAALGEWLRRWHRYRPDLTEGDGVHILTVEYMARQGRVRPQTKILKSMTENPDLASYLFAARSGSLKAVG
jgi:hypothetical protein